MPRMTRKQALDRLQAVCDKKGWRELRVYRFKRGAEASFHKPFEPRETVKAPTLTDLVAAFERLAQ